MPEPVGTWTVTSRDPEDPKDAVGEFDRGLLGRLQVAALGGVGGQHLDGGVGPVGGDDLDAPGGDVQDSADRGGGVELLHRSLHVRSSFLISGTLRCFQKKYNIYVASRRR